MVQCQLIRNDFRSVLLTSSLKKLTLAALKGLTKSSLLSVIFDEWLQEQKSRKGNKKAD